MNGLNNPIGYKSNQTLQQPFIMNPFRFGGGLGAWKELDRVTLGSEQDLISVTGLPNNQYYMLLYVLPKVSAANTRWTFNATTGNEYSSRSSNNGGSDNTFINGVNFYTHAITGGFNYGVGYISNLSSQEKLCSFNETGSASAGAGTASDRAETVGKWADTSNSISSIQLKNTDTGGFDSGSELVVLGWDSTNTTTDNFWQELASVDFDASTPDELVTGTIPAKKYLFVQAYINGTAVGLQDNTSFRFNGDIANNYSFRNSNDGAADTTVINYNYLRTLQSDTGNKSLSSTFIVNNSANEKLLISNAVKFTTAGGSTAPNRNDMVGKWANTSAQITDIKYWQSGSGSFDTGSTLKVWGHD